MYEQAFLQHLSPFQQWAAAHPNHGISNEQGPAMPTTSQSETLPIDEFLPSTRFKNVLSLSVAHAPIGVETLQLPVSATLGGFGRHRQ